MNRPEWIYTSEAKRPEKGEIILCDLGKEKPFIIAQYNDSIVTDTNTGMNYSFTFDLRRWFSIGKHANE